MPKPKHITPSKFKDVLTKGRGKDKPFGDTALSYAEDLAMEMLGVTLDEVTAPSLQWGLDLEPVAIEAYQMQTFNKVDPVEQSIHHPTLPYVCGLPDGLVGTDGMVEIKCPKQSRNHKRNLVNAYQYEKLYKAQIQGYLWITGRNWCDFVSFDPRFPEDYQLAIHRIERDDDYIEMLEHRIKEFWQVVADEFYKLTASKHT